MANCKSCEGAGVATSVLHAYEASGLRAPFKVILENAVKVEVCEKCDARLGTYVPDMEGLFHAVVFARALEPRKLNGAELKFMRQAMNWKAKEVARHLGISAEHLSRCESGDKVMALGTEKMFRVYCLLRTPDRSALEELDLSGLFDLLNIDPTWDASKPLAFYFVRRPIHAERADKVDERWRKDEVPRMLRAS
jgi:transcriptional regulator with XRE-family HTH domain